MLKNDKKRIRSSNFSAEEEEILLKCVLQRKDIIECKKTDALTTNLKKMAWDQVAQEFNSRCPNLAKRTPKALRDKYSNAKATLRRQFAAKRTGRHGNSGSNGGLKHNSQWKPKNKVLSELARNIELLPVGETLPHSHDSDEEKSSRSTSAAEMSAEVKAKVNMLVPKVILSSTEDDGAALNNSDTSSSVVNQQQTFKNDWSDSRPVPRITAEQLTEDPLVASPLSEERKSNENFNENYSMQKLKRKMLNREMEMREEEHKAKMELFAAKINELREKSEFRQQKLLLLRKINFQIKRIQK